MNQGSSPDTDVTDNRPAERRAVPVSERNQSLNIVSASWRAPIPPPDMLRQYDDVVPGSAERILRVWEEQSDHRIQVERIFAIGDSKRAYLGIACAFTLSLLMIAIAAYAVALGNPWAGVAVIGADIAALAGVFIYGTNSRRRERERKAADANPRRD